MIRPTLLLLSSLLHLTSASPQNFPVPKGDGTSGSGKYPAAYSVHPTLAEYTIYSPKTPPTGEKLPVILWGNGMCSDQGLGFRNFLTEVASHGYYIIANGKPEGKGQSADTKMGVALDWVTKNAGVGDLGHVDGSKIAAAGQSCGGTQAYKVSVDKRVTLTGIFDSGNLFGNFKLTSLHAPVGYFLGGSGDMAYGPGTKDFAALPANIPGLLVNNPKGGHMQTFMDKQGGLVATAAVHFFNWFMKDDTTGKEFFTSKESKIAAVGWEVQMKNMK